MNRLGVSPLVVAVFLVCAMEGMGQAQRTTGARPDGARAEVPPPVEPDSPSASSSVAADTQTVVPRLMKFSGALHDATGKPLSGSIDVTFALYNTEAGGEALWFETQSVQADDLGRYTALLGAMHSDGLPVDLFTSGDVRWLGIQVGVEAEQQPRVLLVSVPYALKAGDAETLGGKPASAYVLADSESGTSTGTAGTSTTGPALPGTKSAAEARKSPAKGPQPNVSGTGNTNFLAKWTDNAGTLGNSMIFDTGTSVGIGTSSPGAVLDVQNPSTQNNIALRATNANGTIMFVPNLGAGSYNSLAQAGDQGMFFYGTAPGAGNLVIAPWTGTFNSGLRITTAGRVGIGTPSPVAALHVGTQVANTVSTADMSNTSGILLSGTDSTVNVRLQLGLGGAQLGGFGGWIQSSADPGGGDGGVRPLILNPIGGNVGIGTTTLPGAQLDVQNSAAQNNIALRATNANGTMMFIPNLGAGAYNNLAQAGDQGLIFYGTTGNTGNFVIGPWAGAGSPGIRITTAGNVGIGTSAPTATLEVNGSAQFDGAVTFANGQSVTGNVSSSGQLISTVTTGTAPLSVASTTQVPNLNASFLGGFAPSAFAQTGAPNTFTSTQTFMGSVGIGTSAPSAKLTVNNNLDGILPGVPAIFLGNPSGTTVFLQGKDSTHFVAIDWLDPSKARIYTSGQPLLLQPDFADGGNGGNVGIGTTPAFPLEVAGSAASTEILGRTATQAANDTLFLGQGSQGNFFLDRESNGGQIILGYNTPISSSGPTSPFQVYNNSSDRVLLFEVQSIGASGGLNAQNAVLMPYGIVGIGTTLPDANLTVNGTADKPGGGSWGTFSDARLKTVDGGFYLGLKQVLKLNPVVYHYNEQNALGIKDQDSHIGFVAQEVEKVIPEAVSKDAQGYRIVNNDPILWAMLNAIKAQQAELNQARAQNQVQQVEIQKLTRHVRELSRDQTDIAALKARLDRLEARESTTRRVRGPGAPKSKQSVHTEVARARF